MMVSPPNLGQNNALHFEIDYSEMTTNPPSKAHCHILGDMALTFEVEYAEHLGLRLNMLTTYF